jgi:Asp/Glu/hydantoin racemase
VTARVPAGSPTIALVHATPAAMEPARAAFADRFPQARLWNLLDDRLISEAEAAGGLTSALRDRMHALIRYAVDGGADAVLMSCSMYGPVALEAATGVAQPVLASDQALFDAVATTGAGRVAVLGPIAAGTHDTVARLRAWLADRHLHPSITGSVVAGAREAGLSGDQERFDHLVVDAARAVEADADVLVLGQFSLAPAQPAVAAAVTVPVLSPPHLAADVLRGRLAVRALA